MNRIKPINVVHSVNSGSDNALVLQTTYTKKEVLAGVLSG